MAASSNPELDKLREREARRTRQVEHRQGSGRWVQSEAFERFPNNRPDHVWDLELKCCDRTAAVFTMYREHPAATPGADPVLFVQALGASPFGQVVDTHGKPVQVTANTRLQTGDKVRLHCPTCPSDLPISYASLLRMLQQIRAAQEAGKGPRRMVIDVETAKPLLATRR